MLTPEDGPLLHTFALVARHGSFSGAAADLRLSRSVISERIQRLEERCGVRLLERTTRRLRLTHVGEEVLEASAQMDDTLRQLALRLDSSKNEPSGLLRVSTTHDLGSSLVAPVIARLLATYPKVTAEIFSEDSRRDMLETGIDCAVRLGNPQPSSFVMRQLASLEEPIIASPSQSALVSHATRPSELTGVPWVRHEILREGVMHFTGPGGARDSLIPQVRIETNSGSTLLSLVLEGAGLGVLPEHAVKSLLLEGRLVRVCPDWIWRQITLYALVPSRPFLRPVVRAFLNLLQERVNQDRSVK